MDGSRLRAGRWSAARCALPALLVALPLALPACAVRLIADRDEVLVAKVATAHERLEALFLALEDAALTATPDDGAFAVHAGTYKDVLVLLRGAEVHASAMPLADIPVEQVALLRDSVQRLRDQHRQAAREFSVDLVLALREPFAQHVRAILRLQQELER